MLNDYKDYRMLDVHTFMKVNFKFGEKTDKVLSELLVLQKKYAGRIQFDYHVITV